jgi:hypothetical protein
MAEPLYPLNRRSIKLATLFYIFAALVIVWLTRFKLVGDTISYIQAARHYSAGETDLAINSWWSPLLPWLIIPFLKLGVEPLLALKLVLAGSGLFFALGVRRLVIDCTGGEGHLIGLVMASMAALIMLYGPPTPDLLFAGVVIWYFVYALQLLRGDSLSGAVKCGVLGGIAYLAKAYALPFVVSHLALTFILKFLFIRPIRTSQAFAQLTTALVLIATISGPWIGIISRHDGHFTISSAGKHWTGMDSLPPGKFPAVFYLQDIRPGRITVGENPMEVRVRWVTWSPRDGIQGLKKQYQTVYRNLFKVADELNEPDIFGFLKLTLVTCFIFNFPFRRHLKQEQGLSAIWLGLTSLLFIGGYILIVVWGRYLWPIWGVMIVLAVIGPGTRRAPENGPEDGTSSDTKALNLGGPLCLWHRIALRVLIALIGMNLLLNVVAGFIGQTRAEVSALRAAAKSLPPHQSLAATEWDTGLDFAYWNDGRYFGLAQGKDPSTLARELAPFGRLTLLVNDPQLSAMLATNSFTPEVKINHPVLRAFLFDPALKK